MAEPRNQAEIEAWNTSRGHDWVRLQPELETLFSGVTTLLLDAADPRPGDRVLDIGCGAGDTTLAFAARLGPRGLCLGIDISDPLIAHARSRLPAGGPAGFLIADAQTHAFDPDSHDLAVSRFGVMFFDDEIAAFRNIARALRPGGRMVLAAWAPANTNPWFTIPASAAEARVGPMPPAPPATTGPLGFQDTGRVLGLMRAAGLAGCTAELRSVDLTPLGGLDAAAALALHLGPVSRHIAARGGTEADRAAIAAEVRGRLAAYDTASGLRIPAGINLFQARRPG